MFNSKPSLSDLADGANGHGRRGDNREGVRAADRPDIRDGERGALNQNVDGTDGTKLTCVGGYGITLNNLICGAMVVTCKCVLAAGASSRNLKGLTIVHPSSFAKGGTIA